MSPIDPRLVRARRFPVHAAVDRCNQDEVRRLVDDDAQFHLGRKIPELELSVVHTACTARNTGHAEVVVQILEYLVKMSAPIHDPDSTGQTPLHYAVCYPDPAAAAGLTQALLSAGCDPDTRRRTDGFAPLHLAAMMGRVELARLLVHGGASLESRETGSGRGMTPAQVARHFRMQQLPDLLSSPRKRHRPPDGGALPPQFADLEKKVAEMCERGSNPSGPLPAPVRLKEDLASWRDGDGNGLLHLAAWRGDLRMLRAALESGVKGRRMTAAQNDDGATPMAMAIIAGQDAVVEEFFQNKHSKKQVDLSARLKSTGENLAHLLFLYAPYVHPKFILKRKDANLREVLATADDGGATPVLRVAQGDRRVVLHRILANKAVKDSALLDLNGRDASGRTVLHHVLRHGDLQAFRDLLELANSTNVNKDDVGNRHAWCCLPDPETGLTPLQTLLANPSGRAGMIRELLTHPTGAAFGECTSSSSGERKKNLLHILVEGGQKDLFELALERGEMSFALNAQDSDGLTPLMRAAALGRPWALRRATGDPALLAQLDLGARSDGAGENLLAYALRHLVWGEDDEDGYRVVESLLGRARLHVNDQDAEGRTAVTLAASLGRWRAVRAILDPEGSLRVAGPGSPGLVDINVADKSGNTCLVYILLVRTKLMKLEQSCLVKKDAEQAQRARDESGKLWDLVKLILEREREIFGPTMVQGRDGGSDAIRKQLASCKAIKQPTVEEVEREFRRQYIFVNKKKSSTTASKESAVHDKTIAKDNSNKRNNNLITNNVIANSSDINNNKNRNSSSDEKAAVVEKPKLKLIMKSLAAEEKKEEMKNSPSAARPKEEAQAKKTNKENRKSLGTPVISLDDLRDPQAFEKMVAGLEDAIATEKKKKKKNSVPKSKKNQEEEEDKQAVNTKLDGGGNDKEWSPPRPVTPRKRIPHVRKASGGGGEGKPPIPSEKSPPPPDVDGGKDDDGGGFGFPPASPPVSSPAEINGHLGGAEVDGDLERPRRNDVVVSPPPPTAAPPVFPSLLTGFTQVTVTAPPEMAIGGRADKSTQTEVVVAATTTMMGSQTCCCACHLRK